VGKYFKWVMQSEEAKGNARRMINGSIYFNYKKYTLLGQFTIIYVYHFLY